MVRVTACAAVAAAVLGLSGCGVSGTDFRPGVAADVGDDRIYTEDVDVPAADACDYYTEQGGGETFPKADIRSDVLRLVVQRAATEQLLSESDVEAPALLDSTVQDFMNQYFPDATEEQDDSLREITEGTIVVQTGLVALGADLLADEGTPVDPTQQDVAAQRGFEELSAWLLDHDVELNPVYGIAIDDDGQLAAEYETSVVASLEAGYAAQPDQEDPPSQEEQEARQAYLDGLPASQTCG